MIWWALAGCLSEERVAEEQAAAAQQATDLLALALVTAELVAHAADEPEEPTSTLRHGDACGCPCVDRIGTDDSYVQELDYEQPWCVPWSGLLPASVAGHVWLDIDEGALSITRSEWSVGDAAVSPSLEGTTSGDPSQWTATLSGDLLVGQIEARFDGLTVELGADRLTVEGGAVLGEATWSFDGVTLPAEVIGDACPTPVGGSARTDEVDTTWTEGAWTVAWRQRETTYAPCAFEAPFLGL